MNEQQTQSKIKKKLETEGWEVIKLIRTSHNGISDLMALKDGKAMFIEVKTDKGVLSPLQVFRIDQLRKLGFEVKIWTDYGKDFKS